VEAPTAIFNLIAGMSEICVRSDEILTADCGVLGVRLVWVVFSFNRGSTWNAFPVYLSLGL
jgi:hypothetical protein